MKYVTELPPDLYDNVQSSAKRNGVSFSAFVEAALRNQLALEQTSEGSAVGERRPAPSLNQEITAAVKPRVPSIRQDWQDLRLNAIQWDAIKPIGDVDTVQVPIWGQVNRLFPLKFALRVLARQLASSPKVTLSVFYREAGEHAMGARKTLEQLDDANDIPRGERLSAAFPQQTDLALKRYREQFLGRLTRDGKPVGALPDLGLISIAPGEEALQITRAGLKFAQLPNPIIDEAGKTDSLSLPESDFLIQHIARHLKPEFDFMLSILRWIKDGINRPADLTNQVQQAYPKWTDKMANTMRSGAMGRLHDLGLLGRQRVGLEVEYVLPDRGQQFISKPEQWMNATSQ